MLVYYWKADFGRTINMDKLQLTGRNLGRVFYFINGCVRAMHFLHYRVKLPKLKSKTRPKQLLGSLSLDIALPCFTYSYTLPIVNS